jgi:hypothetical protein
MSTTAVIPPPNSSSLERRAPRLTEKARALLTAMNLHFAGVAALAVLALYCVVHLVFVFQGLKAHDAAAMDQQRVELRSAELAAMPLRGLDKKLEVSTADADAFYAKRLPYAVSQVAAELGALTKREGVHLTRIQYSYLPVLSGSGALTEVKMDASVSGDYRPVVQFINATERDKVFFVINGINLTGQQTGQVNLRLRLTTYLRAPRAGEMGEEVLPTETGEAPAGGSR